MSRWADELASWRDLAHWDSPPSEEEVVSMFVYHVIDKFIEDRAVPLAEALATDEDGRVIDRLIDDWIEGHLSKEPVPA